MTNKTEPLMNRCGGGTVSQGRNPRNTVWTIARAAAS